MSLAHRLTGAAAVVVLLCAAASPAVEPARKPNVLILYADDLGYADLGATGCQDCRTPHIDSLAKNGVRFSNSYVTACVCSPSRAGLLTGRYQQRFGFDANAEGERKNDRAPRALDIKQMTFAQRFKELGYATGLVGKWHLGGRDEYLPQKRGFDEFYGLLPHGIGADMGNVQVYRGTEKVATPDDHTTAFGREGEAFIDRHRGGPFFLDMAFTAVHAPHVSPEEYQKKYAHVTDRRRQRYLAMLACLDDAIGGILGKLREHQLEENTLIFFASDNGGPQNQAVSNGVFRGGKWSLWEGGIRSPIFIQWKGHIPAGRELTVPTTQLDWLPTALAAAGVTAKPEWQLDGVNLLPLLEGQADAPARDALYWRFGVQYAVRQGSWKLVKPSLKDAPKLFDLSQDPGEKTDLEAQRPEKVKELQALWDAWNAKNEPPRWTDERWNGLEAKAEQKKKKK